MDDIRKDFPVLKNNPWVAYLDSACTSLKPQAVIDAEASYYSEMGACGGRSSHRLGRRTSEMAESAREEVARFVNADAGGLIWTRNATEGLNIVALGMDYAARKKVVTTSMEHHAVLLPLMRLRDEGVIKLEVIGPEPDGSVSMETWKNAIDRETALVMTHSWDNTTGCGHPVREIAAISHERGALICVDGAQGVPHHRTDLKKEKVDFLCFSAHKMLGPGGIGALAARREHLGKLRPLLTGGGTVKAVSGGKIVPVDDQSRFEAGVQNYGGMMGFAEACRYLKKIGMENVERSEEALAAGLRKALDAAGAKVYGPASGAHGSLFSFNIGGAKPHDVALMLDKEGVAVRSGFFCAQPAMEALGAKEGAVRASCYVYNNADDIKKFRDALLKIGSLYS
ncbi:MAG: cysteine desulfurase [Candidatus Micrarchaeota archaeon]